MQTYVGYGFNVTNISSKTWLDIIAQYDDKLYNSLKSKTEKEIGHRPSEADLLERVKEHIEDVSSGGMSDYLCRLINENERKKAGADYIVSCYDDYLVFDSVRFADDSPRAKYIRNERDFLAMIARYTNGLDGLIFGNLYEGSDRDVPLSLRYALFELLGNL